MKTRDRLHTLEARLATIETDRFHIKEEIRVLQASELNTENRVSPQRRRLRTNDDRLRALTYVSFWLSSAK